MSEQNLIDCVHTEDTEGCNGGIMHDAYNWIKSNGIMEETSYPYEASVNEKCRFDKTKSVGSCKGFVILQNSEKKLQEAVAFKGPIAVGIDAENPSLQFYSEGIYYDKKCSSENINHAVTVVGYGSAGDDADFWTIKNSWGSGWGGKLNVCLNSMSVLKINVYSLGCFIC